MRTNLLILRRALSATLLILLLSVVGVTKVYAYDFSAVCETGQTLYYNITDATNYYVEVTSPGNGSWSGYTAPTGDLVVPSIVANGGVDYQVVAIGASAFSSCSNLLTVELPNSVKTLGYRAFYFCSKITAITLPDALETIGEQAFSSCSKLTSIDIPNTVTAIGESAFSACSLLESIVIPNSMTTIEIALFYNCTKLATVELPNTITSIGASAFSYCNFASIELPNSLTTIGDNAFNRCEKLTSIVIPNSVTSIGASAFSGCYAMTSAVLSNSLTILNNQLFMSCNKLVNIVIPNTITALGNQVFQGCTLLTAIEIPTSVTILGSSVFSGSGLTSITIPNSITAIPDYAFNNCNKLTSVTIPNTVTTIGVSAFDGCVKLAAIEIPASVTTLGNSVFSGSGLTSITIPDSIAAIPYNAFYNCDKLTSVTIPNVVKTIGNYAFYGCDLLTAVDFLNSVESIGNYAFQTCTKLTSVVIPNTVISIGNSAFSSCERLNSVEFGNSLETIGSSAFSSCVKLTSITIPNSVLTIGSQAFYGCERLTSVNLGNSIETIGSGAFLYCDHLTSITIPNSVITIGGSAFKGCERLTSVVIGNLVETIGNYAFEDCAYLTEIVIPNLVESIGNYAFHGCIRLASVTLGNSVETIREGAFRNCPSITSILLPNVLTTIGQYAFSGCTHLTSIAIPASVQSIGVPLFDNCNDLGQITVDAGNFYYDSRDNCNAIIKTKANDPDYHELIAGCKNTVIPNTVNIIGQYAFYECPNLTSIVVPNSVTDVNTRSFSNCDALTSVVIGNSVTSIGSQAFYDCDQLSTVVIGESVETIGTYAFYDCTALASITSKAEVPPTISSNTFYNVYKNIPVYVPVGTVSDYQSATNWSAFTNIQEIPSYNVVATANPTEGGEVSGGGSFEGGEVCTLTATANEGYTFINWMKDDVEVSTDATYSFAVTEAAEYVANFTLKSYEITVEANPAAGGMVGGGGTYNHGATCTLTATPSANYNFVNWTKDNVVVSMEDTYQFTVTSGGNYVANFSEEMQYTIAVSANPVEGGVVSGGGTFIEGETATLTATANQGYTFINWTEGGVVQSINSTYTFTVSNNRSLVANFDNHTNHWTPESASFDENMALTGVIQIDGVEQYTDQLEIGAFCGDECRGSAFAIEMPLNNRYLVHLTIFGEDGNMFTFKLYDHSLAQELELLSPDSVEFDLDGYGNPTAPYVLNFTSSIIQLTNLVNGWNWYSTYIEQSGIDGLTMLEESLGDAGVRIQGRNQYTEQFEYQGEKYWYGTLTSITNEQMYKVRTNVACEAAITGLPANPVNHPITINSGWNWIGLPTGQSVSVASALGGFTPEADDVLKGRNGSTTYIANYGWYGTLNTLEPGKGYMYKSNSSTAKTLTYQTGRGEATVANITDENNIYTSESSEYADNMLITAVVNMNGTELRSEDYELVAFVGGECRGSVKLMYVEPLDRYVAFLLVFGDEAENISFALTDGAETIWSGESMVYSSDALIGTASSPATIHFGVLSTDDNMMTSAGVYPNPVSRDAEISISIPQNETIKEVVVTDIVGNVIRRDVPTGATVKGMPNTGVYMLQVICESGNIYKNKVVVK